MSKILYPGTFDPIHNGHIDIASRAAELFDELEFVVAVNPEKDTLFSLTKRVNLIKESVIGKENIKVNETRLQIEDLSQYSECFVTGTAAEVTPVKSINETQFKPGNVCKLLIEKYTDLTLS